MFLKFFGSIFKVFSIFHFLAFLASIIIGIFTLNTFEFIYALFFFISGIILYIIGFLLENRIKISFEKLKTKHYVVISAIAFSWLVLPLVSGIVYILTGLNVIDAYFESMAAWTTTGFTMYKDLESLSFSVKFWRSFEQWIGGIGIIAFLVYLLKDNKILYHIVKFEGREELFEGTLEHSIKEIFKIYAILTFFGASLLSFTGMDFFTSINLSMTALATGGMIPISSLNLILLQKIILIVLMIFGATGFLFHYKVFFQDNFKFIKIYEPLKWMVFLIAIVSILGYFSSKINIIDSIFHTVSAITCTGFSYIDLLKTSEGYIFSLIILMIFGGAVGSTAGAVKIDRIIILIKGIRRYVKSISVPSKEVVVETYMNREIKDEDILNAGIYFFLYVLILMISAILFTFYTQNFLYSLFEVASAMGNVGLSLGFVSTDMPLVYKLLFIFLMWGGRIEFLIVIAFLYNLFRR